MSADQLHSWKQTTLASVQKPIHIEEKQYPEQVQLWVLAGIISVSHFLAENVIEDLYRQKQSM